MLPKPIKLLLNLFDALGFFTELPSNNCVQKSRYLCGILVIGLFYVFNFQNILLLIKRSTARLNATVQLLAGLITYAVIFVDALANRRAQRAFWTYDSVHQRELHREPLKGRKWNGILLKVVILLITFIVNVSVSLQGTSIGFKVRTMPAVIATRMYHIRIIQYMICMEVMRENIRVMRTRAIEAGMLQGVEKQCLVDIRSKHRAILHMADCLNDAFGYSQFQLVVLCYFIPLTDLNWTYISYHLQDFLEKTSMEMPSFHFSCDLMSHLSELCVACECSRRFVPVYGCLGLRHLLFV